MTNTDRYKCAVHAADSGLLFDSRQPLYNASVYSENDMLAPPAVLRVAVYQPIVMCVLQDGRG